MTLGQICGVRDTVGDTDSPGESKAGGVDATDRDETSRSETISPSDGHSVAQPFDRATIIAFGGEAEHTSAAATSARYFG